MPLMPARLLCCLLLMPGFAPSFAEDWPSRPIRLIVPFPPGGTSDLIARLIAPALSERLGNPVYVENVPGKAGIVGAHRVVRTSAAAHSFVVTSLAPIGFAPTLFRSVPYDSVRDFTHVAMLGGMEQVLVVNPKFAVTTLTQYVHASRSRRINYGSSGPGSVMHLVGEKFRAEAGVELEHIAYRGSAPALQDLLGGQIESAFDSLPVVYPHIGTGKLLALAVASKERLAMLPRVPTFAESGYPGMLVSSWVGLAGSANVPEPVAARMNAELRAILATPEIGKRLDELAIARYPDMDLGQVAQFVRSEVLRWRPVILAAGAVQD